jgi:hypothetical protein
VLALGICVLLDLGLGRLLIDDPDGELRRADDVYHHGLEPNRQDTASWGGRRFPFATNSLGLRDFAPRNVPLESQAYRVLFMGDSFTEGIGIAYPETFSGLLASSLAPNGIEVLNAGVVGYSPKLYALKTRHLIEEVGLRFDALYVMLDNSDIPNEVIYESYGEGRSALSRTRSRVGRWLTRNSYAAHALGELTGRSRRASWNAAGMPFADDLDNSVFDDPEFLARGHWDEDYKYAEHGFALAETNMAELVTLCRRHGIALTIVVYPWPLNIEYGERDHVQVRFWRAFSNAHDVAFVDLYAEFIPPEEEEGGASREDDHAALFIEGDVHWSALGHATVAGALEPLIRRTAGLRAPLSALP